ncbi:MAG: TetR/AcrR family transcriptional regulator [Thermaerobacter sp.]|nr:TetR/AcrR family transcriptional regulator [Thermaerobacter sp.]
MQAHSVNPDDPRVRRTRQLLQDAMMELMRKKSLQSITVQDIARRAAVNRVTFYAHFEDKYDLMDSIVRTGVHAAFTNSAPLEGVPLEDGLRLLCRTVFAFLSEVQDSCEGGHKQFDPLFETAVQQELYAFVLRWLDNLPAAKANTQSVATVISWTIFGAGTDWSRSRESSPKTTVEMAVDEIVNVLLSGLRSLVADKDALAAPAEK